MLTMITRSVYKVAADASVVMPLSILTLYEVTQAMCCYKISSNYQVALQLSTAFSMTIN